MTNREYRTWVAYLDQELDHPSRTDHYLMQLTGYVSHIMSKKSWQPGDFKLKFKSPQDAEKSLEQRVEADKARWRTRAGLPSRRRNHG